MTVTLPHEWTRIHAERDADAPAVVSESSTLSYGAFGQDVIREAVKQKKPFCLSISFKAPHKPATPDPRFNDVYAGQTFTKPGNFGREFGEHLSPQSKAGRQYPRFKFKSRRPSGRQTVELDGIVVKPVTPSSLLDGVMGALGAAEPARGGRRRRRSSGRGPRSLP